MTGMDVLAVIIGAVWGTLATWGFAAILMRGKRIIPRQRQEPPAFGLYPGQIIIIERPMLKDGEP